MGVRAATQCKPSGTGSLTGSVQEESTERQEPANPTQSHQAHLTQTHPVVSICKILKSNKISNKFSQHYTGKKECYDDSYNTEYESDKVKGSEAYGVPKSEKAIMEEIQTNGPVSATFTVYDDFFYYDSGVYSHVYGGLVGGHAVRMIGWGEESGTPYWLVANSWAEDWGINGFFKIKRGNECGIENDVTAALP